MSRRPPAGADRTEANRVRLKQIVKLESNKSCADCKRNKHPRWASWNIGVFVCIRCSGIHRGMGTHVSRVKSVDLDSWTDEQTESMIKWGNARANKYWEHKLAEGHVPNESKIENFIRTKYDSKRWVMDGPLPDPNTLSDGYADDDVPLNVVQERVKRSGSTVGGGSAPGAIPPPPAKAPPVDLFGDVPVSQPVRPSTTEPALSRATPPRALPTAPKQTKPGESLLGLDFFGGTQSAEPARPLSTGPNALNSSGRSDLKQSILSLYASKPAAAPAQPAAAASAFGGMQGMQSPPLTSPTQATALGGMSDAFRSLSFSSQPAQKPAPFANFAPPTGQSRHGSIAKSPPPLSGGNFFDAKPSGPLPQTSVQTRQASNSFGTDFGEFSSASPVASAGNVSVANDRMGDLFDMSTHAAPSKPAVASPVPAKAPLINYSAFNLSKPASSPAAASGVTPAPRSVQPTSMAAVSLNHMDAWGSNEAWAKPDPPAAAPSPGTGAQTMGINTSKSHPAPAVTTIQSPFDSGWADAEPAKPGKSSTSASGFTVQQDEEFGGWSHASPVGTSSAPKPGGLGGQTDDLFDNVWG